MSHRLLHILLICVSAWGVSSGSINSGASASQRQILLSQGVDTPQEPDRSGSPSLTAQVQSLQRRLSELGYYNGAIDGVYGPNTQEALADFQESVNLARTGILDALTRDYLVNPAAPSASSPDESEAAIAEDLGTSLSTNESDQPETALDIAQDSPESVPASEADSLLSQNSESNNDSAEGATEDDATASDDAEPESGAAAEGSSDEQQDRGLFQLALIGLAIVVFGGLGGTALLLARRGTSPSDAMEEEPGPVGAPPQMEPPLSRTYTETSRNGSTQLATTSTGSGLSSVKRQTTLSTSGPSTPRLAKVNIVDELIHDLDNPNPGIRRKAIWELGQRGNSTAVQPLVGLIVNADSHEQCLILAALAEIGSQTLKPMNRALVLSLQSENPEVRKNAIRDLTRIYDLMGHVGRALGQAASDDDPDVRQTAQWALNQLNRMRLTPTESAGLLQESKTAAEPFSDNKSTTMESLPQGSTAAMEHFAEGDPSIESLPGDEASSRTL
ncbi:MAG: peptidoglycan-binding protein [Leptolyngbyaceae cyanobacterium]